MADESEDKPWSETGPFEKIWIVAWSIVGGVLLLTIVALLIGVVVNETRWTFTRVNPERVCKGREHGHCLIATRGRVTSVDYQGFTVSIDRAPYRRYVTSLSGQQPKIGTQVILEDWHDRLVSVVDPVRGRRTTNQWPNPRKDALEALAALGALLLFPMLFVVSWILERIDKRKKRSIAGSVTDRRAHAS
jgi:hypothetical protein